VLISEDEARTTIELEDMYVWNRRKLCGLAGMGRKRQALNDGYRYASNTNTEWLELFGNQGNYRSD
jgi:hypothetical protein